MEERVQKLMAQANIGSRRACEEIIRQKRVQVNGKVIQLGAKADPEKDEIRVDGTRLKFDTKIRYIAFNKPKGILSTTQAEKGDSRDTIRDLIPVEGHWFVIGRLDVDSEGLMILTNDGDLTYKFTHPRFEHTKTYKVVVRGNPSRQVLEQWQNGVWLDDSRTAACHIKVLNKGSKSTTLRIVMTEGRKRQIRRIATMLGHPTIRLVRTSMGQLGLGTLQRGTYYELDEEEIKALLMPAPELKLIRERRQKRKKRKQKS